jgi:myo-inositol-hexaphosphate 3-phosphohydrolase
MLYFTIDNQSLPALHNGQAQPDSSESSPAAGIGLYSEKKTAKYHVLSPIRI